VRRVLGKQFKVSCNHYPTALERPLRASPQSRICRVLAYYPSLPHPTPPHSAQYTCSQTKFLAAGSVATPPLLLNIKLRYPTPAPAVPGQPVQRPSQWSVAPMFLPEGSPLPGIYRRGETPPKVTAEMRAQALAGNA
jgi:hypothetical protein